MKNHSSERYWIVFMLIAAIFTLVEGLDLYKDIEATNWPTSPGYIDRTYMSSPVIHSMPEYGPMFEPLRSGSISFSFEVNGIRYTSNNKSFGFTFSDNIELISPADNNRPKVKVYFNPLDPNEAVLIPGPKAINIGFVVLFCLRRKWTFMPHELRKSNALLSFGVPAAF